MCGIAGVYITSPKGHEHHEYMKDNFSTLLVAAQVRGTDAAGVFVLKKGKTQFLKSAGKAKRFIDTPAYAELLSHVGKRTTALVGHTRNATTGSPSDNSNNHPIWDNPIIGVHNGILTNHVELDAKYQSVAEVDSAAGIAAISSQVSDRTRLTKRKIADALEDVKGVYTFVVGDVRTGELFVARNTNPIVYYHDTEHGLLWFASTEAIMEKAFPKAKCDTQGQYTVRQLLPDGSPEKAYKSASIKHEEPKEYRATESCYVPLKYRLTSPYEPYRVWKEDATDNMS